ncbi:MAG: hypothetical protein K0S71_1370 [Clostridia bacterium]|jgi:hypothetical protein|nr:hypothetical protein [Clostridia bacterium]
MRTVIRDRKEKIMDFLYKNRRMIVVVLALVMIGLGVFQMLTGIQIDSSIMKGIEYIVMFGALYLLLILPKRYTIQKQSSPSEEEPVTIETSLHETDTLNNNMQVKDEEK